MFCVWCANDMKDGVCTVCGKNEYGQKVQPRSAAVKEKTVSIPVSEVMTGKRCNCCRGPIENGFCKRCGRHESWQVESREDYEKKISYHVTDYDFDEHFTKEDFKIKAPSSHTVSIVFKVLWIILRIFLTILLVMFGAAFFMTFGMLALFFSMVFKIRNAEKEIFRAAFRLPFLIWGWW